MTLHPPELWLVRHGQTEWSKAGKHTSVTDIDLTEVGAAVAIALKERIEERLAGGQFAAVLTSPRLRARRTAQLAGYPDAHVEDDLVEWDYGDFEGITTQQIRETVPGWTVWTHPTPRGEDADQVSTRLDRVLGKIHAIDGRVLVFTHGHAGRALTARWLQQPVKQGRHYRLDTATLSILTYERETPVIGCWNS